MRHISIFNKILNSSHQILHEYAEAKTAYENISEQSKPILAKIAQNFSGSEAKKEKEALASQDYETYLEGLSEAREHYLKKWASYKNLEIQLSVAQSLNKANTAEINISNFK